MTNIIRGTKLWWGYVDYNEQLHCKAYTTDRAIRNAEDSGTTIGIFEPFYAENIDQALEMIIEKWREARVHMKKDIIKQ